jgi:hypothetical protein
VVVAGLVLADASLSAMASVKDAEPVTRQFTPAMLATSEAGKSIAAARVHHRDLRDKRPGRACVPDAIRFFTVEFLRALLPVLILFGVSFSVGPRIADWSGRLNSNETELLRPVSRRDVRNHLFTAIAFDKLLHFALGIGLYVFLAVGLGLRSLGVWLVADIVFLATASYFSATAMKWLVVQTRDGIFNVVRELTFLLLWPASFMPVILWPEHVPTLAASVTMHIALCIAAGWSALRHWETFEVA